VKSSAPYFRKGVLKVLNGSTCKSFQKILLGLLKIYLENLPIKVKTPPKIPDGDCIISERLGKDDNRFSKRRFQGALQVLEACQLKKKRKRIYTF